MRRGCWASVAFLNCGLPFGCAPTFPDSKALTRARNIPGWFAESARKRGRANHCQSYAGNQLRPRRADMIGFRPHELEPWLACLANIRLPNAPNPTQTQAPYPMLALREASDCAPRVKAPHTAPSAPRGAWRRPGALQFRPADVRVM